MQQKDLRMEINKVLLSRNKVFIFRRSSVHLEMEIISGRCQNATSEGAPSNIFEYLTKSLIWSRKRTFQRVAEEVVDQEVVVLDHLVAEVGGNKDKGEVSLVKEEDRKCKNDA